MARSCIAIRRSLFWNFVPCSVAHIHVHICVCVFWKTYDPHLLPTLAFSIFQNLYPLIKLKIEAIKFKAQIASLYELSINTLNRHKHTYWTAEAYNLRKITRVCRRSWNYANVIIPQEHTTRHI